jgi:hypothetical protein
MITDPRRRDILLLATALGACDAGLPAVPALPAGLPARLGMGETPAPPGIAVIDPVDETGGAPDGAALGRLRDDVVAELRLRGLDAAAARDGRAPVELRLKIVQWQGPDLLPPALHDGAMVVASLHDRGWRRTRVAVVSGTPRGTGSAGLARAVTTALAPALGGAPFPGRGATEITATGRPVRHRGGAVFAVGDDVVDLSAIAHAHDPLVDPDVPAATDVTLHGAVPSAARGSPEAVITLYQIDPPLTGLPSRQPGIDRSIDFRDPANLVKSAYANIVSTVQTEDARPVPVASHPVGHFLVKVEVPGFPTLLTGMTTIDRGDAELFELTITRNLGIGGVLLTSQPGRLNGAAEAARELALRQRRLRVVDGLYWREVRGRNAGPEYLIDHGNVVFTRIRVPVANGTDALACFAELVARGGHNRFGSLLNRTFRGTGAGCAAFAMSWLQAAGVVPFLDDPPAAPPPAAPEALGPLDFWRAVHAGVRIPWAHLGCDERVGAAQPFAARYTLYDLLLHNESPSFVQAATEGLAERVRARAGPLAGTVFEAGIRSPLRGLVVLAGRRDPLDVGAYAWGGEGLDVTFWENARFSAWVRRCWEAGPRHPGIRLMREGRFRGLEIDAMDAPRQREPFFAAADRRAEALRAVPQPAASCEAAFARGLE